MITGTTGEAKAAVNPYIFIGSAVFAYLTVLISCMKPAKIAGKVSPMEALRYTDTGTTSKRKIKKSTGGASIPKMALANLGRNKKRTVTVSTNWTATFHFTLLPLVICTPILIVFAILIPYICFKNLEKQSIVERLRATD